MVLPAIGIRRRSGPSAATGNPTQVIWKPSPNFGDRRGGVLPTMVVLHYTAMQDAEGALSILSNPNREIPVSAHYLIGRDGTVWQLVDESKRAWHAGVGFWGGQDDVNSRSIGIEMDNDGYQPFTAPLMAALEDLLPGILKRWAIRPESVIGHSDMAPTRKIDPGGRFDWQRLARQGLTVWPSDEEGSQGDVGSFIANAQRFGYPIQYGLGEVLKAFRARFRPGATGPLDARDAAIMSDLAHRYPVDRIGLTS